MRKTDVLIGLVVSIGLFSCGSEGQAGPAGSEGAVGAQGEPGQVGELGGKVSQALLEPTGRTETQAATASKGRPVLAMCRSIRMA